MQQHLLVSCFLGILIVTVCAGTSSCFMFSGFPHCYCVCRNIFLFHISGYPHCYCVCRNIFLFYVFWVSSMLLCVKEHLLVSCFLGFLIVTVCAGTSSCFMFSGYPHCYCVCRNIFLLHVFWVSSMLLCVGTSSCFMFFGYPHCYCVCRNIFLFHVFWVSSMLLCVGTSSCFMFFGYPHCYCVCRNIFLWLRKWEERDENRAINAITTNCIRVWVCLIY